MKIFVNARFLTQPLSGVQRYAIECSLQIKKLHSNVIFLCPKNVIHKDIADQLGTKIIGRNTGHLWEQVDLPLFMARQKHSPLLNLANTAPLLYSNNFVTIHDLAFYHHPEWNSKQFSAWYNILIPRIAYSCRYIFTVSQTMRNEIIKYYNVNPSKVGVTYNGISESMKTAVGVGKTAKEKLILSVGSFNARKNHQKLIDAFLKSTVKDEYQLVIVGDKNRVFSETNLNEDALKNSNIIIHQHFSEQELIAMYRKASIVVSLSVYEGFGIPLLEGLYCGCKILCSDIPVYRELYENYGTFCDPRNVQGIISALELAVNSAETISESQIALLLEKCSYLASAKTIVDRISLSN